MIPRPFIGFTYDRGGHEMTVQSFSDTHVVCTCPECEPGVKPCTEAGHVFTREEFARHLGGAGPMVEWGI